MREWEPYICQEDLTAELAYNGNNMLKSLSAYFGCEPNEQAIERRVYKDTECGAWIKFHHDAVKITIGSIVEGSDAECVPVTLSWPFPHAELEQAIEDIEAQADMLWREANEE
jgi:hypothetical protein